ncbi:aspartyl/asparaginyl beta-hydroxylase domain-containing protein [Algoriphagus machipongonensis]|uniref:Aspartyl/asparaginyl beta-hydroxylase family protein n=1 Tax=Algoriphagus machipongonensis TaxID=388413 RepID=A3I076_9BACT|nr:aspartyl/asparaginyl beta-hydroxylase domain-containing protein [Algoriphagus machipongonensis]EAZ79872.1 aspartyl/asparaginyl beta-hydroxylase family protein [Algoriphagus machipongonensis]
METKQETKDRIQLPFKFDVEKMVLEAKALKQKEYEYYNVIPLRSPAHLVDTSLPFPPPADDYADGTWTDWLDTPALKSSPYLKSIIEFFSEYTTVNLVRLLFLAPNSIVKEHTDPTLGLEQEKSMIRLTIPVDNNEGVEFYLNDELVPMKVGECWYLRLTDPHRVFNKGTTDRINLTIDIIPNDQIIEILNKAM